MRTKISVNLLLISAIAIPALVACGSTEPIPQKTSPNSTPTVDVEEGSLEIPAINDQQIARYYIKNGLVEESAKPLGIAEGPLILRAACTADSQETVTWTLTVGSSSEEGGEIVCGTPEVGRVIQAVAGEDVSLTVLHDSEPSLVGYISITQFEQ